MLHYVAILNSGFNVKPMGSARGLGLTLNLYFDGIPKRMMLNLSIYSACVKFVFNADTLACSWLILTFLGLFQLFWVFFKTSLLICCSFVFVKISSNPGLVCQSHLLAAVGYILCVLVHLIGQTCCPPWTTGLGLHRPKCNFKHVFISKIFIWIC